jgi:hypothetical protein
VKIERAQSRMQFIARFAKADLPHGKDGSKVFSAIHKYGEFLVPTKKRNSEHGAIVS